MVYVLATLELWQVEENCNKPDLIILPMLQE